MSEQKPPWIWQKTAMGTFVDHKIIFTGEFDESWYQGRGVFGGLTAAVILQAMIELEPHRPPRTFTLHCLAPVLAKRGEVRVTCERRGAKVSHLSARLLQEGGKTVALASASFGEARTYQSIRPSLAAPKAPRPNQVEEVPKDLPMMPSFCQYFSYRFCLDGIPYTQSEEAAMGGWCDLRKDFTLSYPYLATVLDAWPPAICPTLQGPMRAATVDLTYHFFCSPTTIHTLTPPFLYRGEIFSLYDGYAEERDCLWDANGVPIASARQLYAIS
jgi:acyl-CoA thioesterase